MKKMRYVTNKSNNFLGSNRCYTLDLNKQIDWDNWHPGNYKEDWENIMTIEVIPDRVRLMKDGTCRNLVNWKNLSANTFSNIFCASYKKITRVGIII